MKCPALRNHPRTVRQLKSRCRLPEASSQQDRNATAGGTAAALGTARPVSTLTMSHSRKSGAFHPLATRTRRLAVVAVVGSVALCALLIGWLLGMWTRKRSDQWCPV